MLGLGGKSATQKVIDEHITQRDAALHHALPDESSYKEPIIVQDSNHRYFGLQVGLQEHDLDILSSDIAGITSGIKADRWTATQVLCAYVRATRRAQIRTNCLTEVFVDKALERTAELDAHFAKTGELVGPLHGVPISLKDTFHIPHVRTTIGFSTWLAKPLESTTATAASILQHLGAVHYVKTNVPQTMMTFESINPVFGRTLNPYSPDHTSGGSSGGESAIVACDGSVAGIGSDIVGSLRIPAHHAGIYTVKPSPGRWAYGGQCDFGKGFESIVPVIRPMCRTAADVETLYLEVVRQQLPKWLRTPRDKNDPKKAQFKTADETTVVLNEAWLNPIGMVEARGAPCESATSLVMGFTECVAALKTKYSDKRVELIEIEPSKLQTLELMRIFLRLLTADGYRTLLKDLGPDKLISQLQLPVKLSRISRWLRGVIVFFIRYIVRDPIYADLAASMAQLSAAEHAAALERRERFVDKWNHTMWHDLALDALIAPTQACPTVSHGGGNHNAAMAGSTVLYNIVRAPVAVLPVLRVDPAFDSQKEKEFEHATADWKSTSKVCNFLLDKTAYDAKKMAGLPVCVQVVTRPYHKEKAIGIMRLLDDALPSPDKRGAAWKNKLDAQGRAVPESQANESVGFGPGTLTKALF
ncbi:related to amidase (acetamidase) [Ustilago sp. UG-2017a]|nr:related to amidase (acetamidase) [Ustilago sp. UG-2017a]